jgi:hypothetical protein
VNARRIRNLQFPPNTQTPPSQDQIRRKTTFKVKGSFYTISQKIKQAEKDIEMTRDRLADLRSAQGKIAA